MRFPYARFGKSTYGTIGACKIHRALGEPLSCSHDEIHKHFPLRSALFFCAHWSGGLHRLATKGARSSRPTRRSNKFSYKW